MRSLRYSVAASNDLDRLLEYVSQRGDGPVTAGAFVEDVRTRCRGLCDFPEIGWDYGYLRRGLRAVPYRTVIILFEVTPELVRIRRVFGQRQDSRRFLRR